MVHTFINQSTAIFVKKVKYVNPEPLSPGFFV
jgi:hypothetical protein